MSESNNLFTLTDKCILITGATGYLGTSMVRGLCEAGATVLVNGRSLAQVDELVKKLLNDGLSAQSAVFDITDSKAVEKYFDAYGNEPLHGLINNAYSGVSGAVETSNGDSYRASYEVTMIASHTVLNAALPALRRSVELTGEASVVNVASMYGVVSPDQRIYADKKNANPPFYGAAKAALIQWTKYAACEFGREGIRINAISPGPFPSLKVQQDASDFVSILASKVPMERIGLANELKGPVVFLMSGAASYVNGANVVVDGGWTCW